MSCALATSANRRHLALGVAALLGAFALPTTRAEENDAEKQQHAAAIPDSPDWRATSGAHGALQPPEPRPNLTTPQATVEYFTHQARAGAYRRAAYALNLELLHDADPQRAANLARQLIYVLNQKLWIDWEGLPDRRDGRTQGSVYGSTPLAGKPRRNLSLGTIDLDGRVVSVRVQRVKNGEEEPVWLISAQTVENIPALYEHYGPSWLEKQLPGWATQRSIGRIPVWQLVAAALIFLLAVGAGMLAWWLLSRYIRHRQDAERQGLAPLARKLRVPLPLALAVLILYAAKAAVLRLTGPVSAFVEPVALLALVGTITAVASAIVSYVLEIVAQGAVERHALDGSDEQRRLLTQVSIAKRVFLLIMSAVAIGIVLLELHVFEAVGVALLASAGAGGVILGLAGQTVLGNLLAGLQIAITRPFRIGDSVYIESNWGRIEEITYTYVVVRTWDYRRLIFPVRYFLEHYIENWSKTHRFLVKPIYLHVDYRLDVGALRDKFFEIVHNDDEWEDTKDSYAAVVDTTDETMVVRLTVGGADPSAAWYVSLRVREQMIRWLQEHEDGRLLPRQRVKLVDPPTNGRDAAAPEHAASRRTTGPRRQAHPAGAARDDEGDSDGDE